MSKRKGEAKVVEGPISGAVPSEKSLNAEARALGENFSLPHANPADIVADAKEMLAFRGDAKDLAARGYQVTDGMYERLAMLVAMISALTMKQRQASVASMKKTQRGEKVLSRLLAIRETFSRIGVAAGLDASLFSLRTGDTNRLSVVIMNMTGLIGLMEQHTHQLPDRQKVEALINEASGLIAEIDSLKTKRGTERGSRVGNTLNINQLSRLMLDVLQHLSHQGLAAYEGDLRREVAYRLDKTYARPVGKRGSNEPNPAPVA